MYLLILSRVLDVRGTTDLCLLGMSSLLRFNVFPGQCADRWPISFDQNVSFSFRMTEINHVCIFKSWEHVFMVWMRGKSPLPIPAQVWPGLSYLTALNLTMSHGGDGHNSTHLEVVLDCGNIVPAWKGHMKNVPDVFIEAKWDIYQIWPFFYRKSCT